MRHILKHGIPYQLNLTAENILRPDGKRWNERRTGGGSITVLISSDMFGKMTGD